MLHSDYFCFIDVINMLLQNLLHLKAEEDGKTFPVMWPQYLWHTTHIFNRLINKMISVFLVFLHTYKSANPFFPFLLWRLYKVLE